MNLDAIFSFASLLALSGWVVLAASPLMPVWSDRIAAWGIPAVLAAVYAALVLVHVGGAEGGFGSLDEVARLFSSRPVLLAGWLHYLAFDLAIGAWEVRDARRRAVPFVVVLPCLAATFLVGPAGFLLFVAVRTFAVRRTPAAA
jgi:hypothetical protein